MYTVYQPLIIQEQERITSYPHGAYRQERENEEEQIFEVLKARNFPKLMIDTKPQISETQ